MVSEYFFKNNDGGWSRLKNDLKYADKVFVFLDYDGTIVPIKEKPQNAVMLDSTRFLLKNLSKQPKVFLSIISGRRIQDIRKMVRVPNIVYAANHGLEIYSPNIRWHHPAINQIIPILKKAAIKLNKALNPIEGVLFEDKDFTLSVHYRQLTGMLVCSLKILVKKIIQPYTRFLKISTGKKVIEIKPKINWNKGKAVLKIISLFKMNEKSFIIYIGDDKTDEDAFRLLPAESYTIYVGKSHRTQARYYLNDTREVIIFLKKLSLILNN